MKIDSYINYLKIEKRYSKHTCLAYSKDLKDFTTYLTNSFDCADLSTVTKQMIRSYIIFLSENQLSPKSINRKLSSLRSFYKYLMMNNPSIVDPLTQIHSLKSKTRITEFIPFSDMEKHFKTTSPDSYFLNRNYVIIELLYQSGIRRSELLELKQEDIDLEACTLKVTGKRNKQRLIPFSPQMKLLLSYYISIKNQEFGVTSTLFLSKKGKPLTASMIYKLVKEELSKITSVSKRSPHILRHTFATHLLNNGASMLSIKELLGHASLVSTQIYTQNTIKQLKNIHEQAHPKG